jgi:hypothetical protein
VGQYPHHGLGSLDLGPALGWPSGREIDLSLVAITYDV